ncbi:MAG: chemotaxis protein-glutamate O-methyltransferase, partial [Kangiellaceae bacterium]|nr:chemotaxis protein-glutamate O-methyltransferase [Kangiellaceae bacterium]
LNLMNEWPMKGPLDLIICRNVLIYFDKPTQQSLVRRFNELLADDGCLILGHSENLSAEKGLFTAIGRTIYRKKQ